MSTNYNLIKNDGKADIKAWTKGVPFEDEKIHALDLRLGNVCNLRCVMCFAGNSNKILKDHKNMAEHFNWKEGRLEKEAEKYHKSNYDWSDDERAAAQMILNNVLDVLDEYWE